MNDQDKEAFEKWFIDFWDNDFSDKGHHKLGFEAWQAICDYKQREIDKLQAENIKFKTEIEVLRQYGNKDCTAMADEVLKELGDK